MKTISSCLLILIFFISCDSDSNNGKNGIANRALTNRMATELPGNAANPYDNAGWIHNELFESYYESPNRPTTLLGTINKVSEIAEANLNFKLIKTPSYQPVSMERIQYILDRKTTCVSDIIGKSTLSVNAKSSLSSFINALIEKFAVESSCDVLYNYVVAYERTIENDFNLTSRDKQIMFITTSVARHSAYLAKKKPKKNTDPDWTILVGHIVAATDGAERGMAEAITESLVTGIMQNQ